MASSGPSDRVDGTRGQSGRPRAWWPRSGLSLALALALALAGAALAPRAAALYEDQAQKWDWRQRFVGRLRFLSAHHLSASQSLVVATEKSVLAALSLRNGSIAWRQVLETRPQAHGGGIDAISSTGLSYGAVGDAAAATASGAPSQSLLTINANGRYVRSWDPVHGLLDWETKLPEDVVGDEDE